MKLQISFDMLDLQNAIDIAKQVEPYCDILEVGTLLIYKYGIDAVIQFKKQFPKKTILADSKIIDRGKETATLFCESNADWISVMAGTSNHVIHSVCSAANNLGKKVMIDLLDSSSVGQSALEAKNLGAHALLFHQPYDEKESLTFLDKWDMVKGNASVPIFISAKIDRTILDHIVPLNPYGIVVGKSITDAKDPRTEAEYYYTICCKD